jgi:hypothetical protein
MSRRSSLGGAARPSRRGRGECRVLNAPAASRAIVKSTRVSHHRYAETFRHSPRDGFNGFLRALSGDRAFLPPSSARCASDITSVRCEASSLVMRRHRRQLSASVGAPRPHDFAVRRQARFVVARHRVHRIPRPTFVTIAKRPLAGSGTATEKLLIWPRWKPKCFCAGDWTGQISLNSLRKLRRSPAWMNRPFCATLLPFSVMGESDHRPIH